MGVNEGEDEKELLSELEKEKKASFKLCKADKQLSLFDEEDKEKPSNISNLKERGFGPEGTQKPKITKDTNIIKEKLLK
jgi:hypothetical protein